jgi:large subunit ribosomal protein L3
MSDQVGLLGKKLGMTEFYREDGTRVPVTVVEVGGNQVTAHRTLERDGYTALQVAFDERKASRVTKPQLGQFKKAEVAPRHKVAEFRCQADALEGHPVGSDVLATIFEAGALVDVTGTSKGKGFQGVMKKYHFKGEKRTHGNHESFRHGGSIGCRLTPGRVVPGKKMPGQMGNATVTVQNLEVARVMADKGIILVRGPVPGSKNGYIMLRPAVKAVTRARHAAGK